MGLARRVKEPMKVGKVREKKKRERDEPGQKEMEKGNGRGGTVMRERCTGRKNGERLTRDQVRVPAQKTCPA